MGRGHGRLERIILQSVNSTRYGCTVTQLAYLAYGINRGDGPSPAQLSAVRDAVDQLIAEERVVERTMLGTDRYILPASPAVQVEHETLQCLDCDTRWVSEEGAPHPDCWSCGKAGRPAPSVTAHAAINTWNRSAMARHRLLRDDQSTLARTQSPDPGGHQDPGR